MTTIQRKNNSINIRLFLSQCQLIDSAATLLNKSRSEFMLEAVCREAENVLLDQRLFFTDDEKFQAFIMLLESPIEENVKLKELLKSKAPWEK